MGRRVLYISTHAPKQMNLSRVPHTYTHKYTRTHARTHIHTHTPYKVGPYKVEHPKDRKILGKESSEYGSVQVTSLSLSLALLVSSYDASNCSMW